MLDSDDVRTALATIGRTRSTRFVQISHQQLVRVIPHAESRDLVGRNGRYWFSEGGAPISQDGPTSSGNRWILAVSPSSPSGPPGETGVLNVSIICGT